MNNRLTQANEALLEQLREISVIPVLRVDNLDETLSQVKELTHYGCTHIEITLRTPLGLKAIATLSKDKSLIVGAGTVTNYEQCLQAYEHGAKFMVSPGVSQGILKGIRETNSPFLGGVGTLSEAMALYELGFPMMKFFPAEANGGVNTLKAWFEPMPQLKFCPTGGINKANYPHYLDLPNVVCVGSTKPLDLIL